MRALALLAFVAIGCAAGEPAGIQVGSDALSTGTSSALTSIVRKTYSENSWVDLPSLSDLLPVHGSRIAGIVREFVYMPEVGLSIPATFVAHVEEALDQLEASGLVEVCERFYRQREYVGSYGELEQRASTGKIRGQKAAILRVLASRTDPIRGLDFFLEVLERDAPKEWSGRSADQLSAVYGQTARHLERIPGCEWRLIRSQPGTYGFERRGADPLW